MMWVFRILFVLMLSLSRNIAGIPCATNYEFATIIETPITISAIGKKEKKLNMAIDAYKEALEKKRKMMVKLWKTTTKIEFLMKENQVLRKEMIKHWKDVKHSHANVKSL